MLYLGIDEAALGPRLGPFCVGLSEFQYGSGLSDTSLYKLLQNSVTPVADKTGRAHIADSKQIYSPAKGIRYLEHGIAVLLELAGINFPNNLSELLRDLCPPADCRQFFSVPWFEDLSETTLPLSLLNISKINTEAKAIHQNMEYLGMQIKPPKLRVITAEKFNRLLKNSKNKADAVQKIVGSLLTPVLTKCLHQPCRVTIDRQGGRKYYGEWLRGLVPGAAIRPIKEEQTNSIYALKQSSIEFAVSADRDRLETAAASMFAKYLREALMHCFNNWWTDRIPGLNPTAGYPQDANRFLQQIDDAGQFPGDADILVRRL